MKKLLPLLGVIFQTEARFDFGETLEPTPSDLQCPPKCSCSKWSCIDDLDFGKLQSENKKFSLSSDQFDDQFRCWKNCCKKQGVQVSTCDRNVCQKCCNGECNEVKNMINMRRTFANKECNTCMAQRCSHEKEYISVSTTRSCRGLFNKYSTPFNGTMTFKVEAERDLRIFLYDAPLSLLRHELRKRRSADSSQNSQSLLSPEFEKFLRDQYVADEGDIDVLDEPDEDDENDDEDYYLGQLAQIYERIRREISTKKEEMMATRLTEREVARDQLKLDRKADRERRRLRKKSQKLQFGSVNKDEEKIDEQIEKIKQKYSKNPKKRPQMQNDYFEEVEEEEEEIEESEFGLEYKIVPNYEEIEYEAEIDPVEQKALEKAAKIAKKKAEKQVWRENQAKLNKMSKTFREVGAALKSDEVRKQVTKKAEKMKQMQNDAGLKHFEQQVVTEESILDALMKSFGWDEGLSNVFPVAEEVILETYNKQKQAKSSQRDVANWHRAQSYRKMNPKKVAELAVKQQLEAMRSRSSENQSAKSVNFIQSMNDELEQNKHKVEEGFADEDSGIDMDGGWIQIGIGSANNTACDLKSCQSTNSKRCIGVLRKRFDNDLLTPDIPQIVSVTVSGAGIDRILTVDIEDTISKERIRIFSVMVDDPTIASLQNMAVCTTKGTRGKLTFEDCGSCGTNQDTRNGQSPAAFGDTYVTDLKRMNDCQFSCLSSNCRAECIPETKCSQCLEKNCGEESVEKY